MEKVKNSPGRFCFADGLRGIAASWVFLFHAHEGHHLDHLDQVLPTPFTTVVFEWGDLGVPIFFVLSGFFMAHSFRKVQITWLFFGNFMVRRLIRLSPPYYGSIALVIGFGLISATVTGESFALPSVSALLAHLFYLQGILGFSQINVIYWTLCVDLQFYLAFCLLMGAVQLIDPLIDRQGLDRQGQSNPIKLLVFSLGAILAALWPLGIVGENLWPGLFLPTWYSFLLGVFAYWAWQEKGLATTLFYSYLGIIGVSIALNSALFAITCIIVSLLLLKLGQFNLLSVYLNWRWLQFLGLVSYSLYLTHNPISGAAFFIGYKLLGENIWTELICLVAVFGLCVASAAGFYWLTEKPSINYSRKVKLT
jgi:peptidoglycan/LPS O-acetylase OafA/YrhL